MTEEIKGLHVKDYTDLTPDALEEMAKLDEQLGEHLRGLSDFLQEEDYERLKYNLDCLIVDNDAHRDYCVKCQEETLHRMACEDASRHFEDYMNPPSVYFDTDSVIDGTDKTPCMYDYAKEILDDRDDIAICRAAHKNSDGDCAECTEPCCSQSGVNNR